MPKAVCNYKMSVVREHNFKENSLFKHLNTFILHGCQITKLSCTNHQFTLKLLLCKRSLFPNLVIMGGKWK